MFDAEADRYCREIEAYLCRKNNGHLIRVVGPSFELVSRWAARGIPLKVAFSGIDRSCDRASSKGPRRRPLKIDFCEADVLDAFDEWRRALGLPTGDHEAPQPGEEAAVAARAPATSLAAHLERVMLKLTAARVNGAIGDAFDDLIERIAIEQDVARSAARGLRGEARQSLITKLSELDRELLQLAQGALDADGQAAVSRDAEAELASFRERMPPEAFARAHAVASERLLRERLKLPIVSYGTPG
jgi:hypothetical protein